MTPLRFKISGLRRIALCALAATALAGRKLGRDQEHETRSMGKEV
jgi:hypothetical protein